MARRNAAVWAGFWTLAVLGGCGYLLAESIISVVRLNRSAIRMTVARQVVNYIELALFGASVLLIILAIPWLRSRRPTFLSHVVMTCEYITFMMQTAASILNGAFIYVWAAEVKARCQSWSLDVAWWSTETCPAGSSQSLNGYLVAAGMRLLVVLIVGAVWLYLLHRFSRLMPLAADRLAEETIPSLLQSSAIRDVLAQHGATLVTLAAGDLQAIQAETQLPTMPTERILTENEQEQAEKSQSTLGWLVSNVQWFFGLSKADPQTADFTRKDASSPLLPMVERQPPFMAGTAAEQFPSAASRAVYGDTAPSTPSRHHPLPLPPGAASQPPSGTIYRPAVATSQTPGNYLPVFPTFLKTHSRSDSDKAASVPLVHATSRTQESTEDHDQSAAYDGIDTSWHEYDSQDSEDQDQSMERLSEDQHHTTQRSSLAPTPGKQLVYVQMSDGQLVRKLSTICSDGTGEISRSASMDSSHLLAMGAQELRGSWRPTIDNGRRSRELYYAV